MSTRRSFLSVLAATPWLATRGLAAPALANPDPDPYHHKNATAKLPAWPGGDSSTSPDGQMWMFRGNPSRSWTGSGKLAANPSLKWRFRMWDFATQKHGEPIVWQGTGWTGQALKVGSYVFIGSTGGHFHCFDATSGKLVWVYTAQRMFKGSPCYYEGRIYVPNVDNRLRCLDAATGKLIWQWSSPNDIDSSPVVVGSKLYIGGEDGAVKCFDPRTGKLLWRKDFGVGVGEKPGSGGIESSLAISNGVAYFGHLDGHVRALRLADQSVLWETSIGFDVDASPLLVGDRLYIGAEEGEAVFACLHQSDGRILWKQPMPKGIWSSAAHVEGKVLVAGNDGQLYCFAAETGRVVWQYPIGRASWSSPAVVDGKVVFGSYDRYLRMVDLATGQLIWQYDLGGRCHSGLCVAEGRIWVGSASGWFYCFGS